MLIEITALALASATQGAVTLRCWQVSEQSDLWDAKDFYGEHSLPVTQDKFVQDIWTHGLVALAIAPSETWVIDFDAGMITDEGSGFAPLEIVEITDTKVRAESPLGVPYRSAYFDRVTGELAVMMTVRDVQSWREEFGVDLKPYRQWDMSCTPAVKLF